MIAIRIIACTTCSRSDGAKSARATSSSLVERRQRVDVAGAAERVARGLEERALVRSDRASARHAVRMPRSTSVWWGGSIAKRSTSPCYSSVMYVNQSIQRPAGVTAFGSALLRINPDYASLRFAVTRLAAKPKDAFDETRRGADAVRAALRSMSVDARDVRTSELTLAEEYAGINEARRLAGYRASAQFHVFVRDFAKVEPVLVAVVDAGADRIFSVHHKSTRMRDVRADARKRAVLAARAKAEGYAEAAGCKLGAPLHIEDVNPDDISRRSHLPEVDLTAEEVETEPSNPGAIAIAGAVLVCFAIVPA